MRLFSAPGIAEWVADRIPGCERGFGECQALGVEREGRIAAGVVYHNWNPDARVIELSAASETRHWLQRRIMRALLEYPFDHLGCFTAVSRCAPENTPVRRLWSALGAIEIELPHLRGPNQSEILMILTREAWHGSKFMRSRHGQAQSADAA